jgi:hypothetical protein
MTNNNWFEDDKGEKTGGSDFYKLVEGNNKMRIMSEPVAVRQAWDGAKYVFSTDASPKYWTWAILRETGDFKIVKLPLTVAKQITMLGTDPDYQFSGFPMPYDITVNAKNAGTKEVEYSVVASRQNTDVTPEETEELGKKTPISEIIEKMRDKEGKTTPKESSVDYPPFEDDVTF